MVGKLELVPARRSVAVLVERSLAGSFAGFLEEPASFRFFGRMSRDNARSLLAASVRVASE